MNQSQRFGQIGDLVMRRGRAELPSIKWWAVIFLLAVASSISARCAAESPPYRSMAIEKKIAISDYVFVGRVTRVVFISNSDFKELPRDASDYRAYTPNVEVEVERSLFERKAPLPQKVLFTLWGTTDSTAKLRKAYEGNRFVFFANLITATSVGAPSPQYMTIAPHEATEPIGRLDDIIHAIATRAPSQSRKK